MVSNGTGAGPAGGAAATTRLTAESVPDIDPAAPISGVDSAPGVAGVRASVGGGPLAVPAARMDAAKPARVASTTRSYPGVTCVYVARCPDRAGVGNEPAVTGASASDPPSAKRTTGPVGVSSRSCGAATGRTTPSAPGIRVRSTATHSAPRRTCTGPVNNVTERARSPSCALRSGTPSMTVCVPSVPATVVLASVRVSVRVSGGTGAAVAVPGNTSTSAAPMARGRSRPALRLMIDRSRPITVRRQDPRPDHPHTGDGVHPIGTFVTGGHSPSGTTGRAQRPALNGRSSAGPSSSSSGRSAPNNTVSNNSARTSAGSSGRLIARSSSRLTTAALISVADG